MALHLRNRTISGSENAENSQNMFRTKQQGRIGGGTTDKGKVKASVGGPRLALGNMVNLNSRDQSKISDFGAIKKQGYGSQNQSRIVKKPDVRPPLRSATSCSNAPSHTIKSKPGGDRITSETTVVAKSRTSVFADPSRKPLTQSSLTVLRSNKAANVIKTEPTICVEPKLVTVKEVEIKVQEVPIETVVPKRESVEKEDDVSSDRECTGSYSAAMIKDIDEEDKEDPQLVAEYVNDVYQYLRFLEKKQSVQEDYLVKQKEVTGKMRSILVDWLVQVHVRFHLLPETLYMTVMLIDRFLQSANDVPKSKLQLVGVSAMFVASKYEEMFAPEIGDFEYITDHSYTCQEIRLMEIEILKTLHFEIGRPLPIHFLRRYSKAAEADADIHSMAKYFMELCLVEYTLCHFLPSLKAAAALWLALQILENEKWTDTLVHYTGYREEEMMGCVRRMSRLIYKTHVEKTKFQSVRNKFATSRFRQISKHPSLEDMERIKAFGSDQ